MRFDSVDWESFYYVWSHLPTLCTLSPPRRALTADGNPSGNSRSGLIVEKEKSSEDDWRLGWWCAALQWPLHCDISPTAFFLHIYFDVAWVGQSPGKWLLGNPRTIIARIDWPRLS